MIIYILLYVLLFIIVSPGILTRVKYVTPIIVFKSALWFFIAYLFIYYILFYNIKNNEYFNDNNKHTLVQKINGKLICKEGTGESSRSKSTIWLLTEADKKYNWPDFPEIMINTGDKGIDSIFSYSQHDSYENVIPDFTFHEWSEVRIFDYTETVNEIDKCGRLAPEINKVGWIGNLATNDARKTLFDIGQSHQDILDIRDMSWTNGEPTKYMSLQDLVSKYSTLIDIEGNGWSGRLKFLLWSHRPLIIVDRPHKEYYFQYLKEWEHYIPVKRDLSDLVEKTQWIMDNNEKALEIANNAYEFAKVHLTRNACLAYLDKAIRNITKNN
jgi:hypothetical protein